MEVSAQRSVLFTNRVPSLTSALRFLSLARLRTLDDLTANFTTHVGGSVNVEIPAARHQVGRLCIGQICRALDRLAPLPVTGTTTPAFCPAIAEPWKCAAVASPVSPE